MEYSSASVPGTVSAVPRAVPDCSTSQPAARPCVHNGTLRFSLSSVRQGALLVDEAALGHGGSSGVVRSRHQCRTGVFLEL